MISSILVYISIGIRRHSMESKIFQRTVEIEGDIVFKWFYLLNNKEYGSFDSKDEAETSLFLRMIGSSKRN